MAQSPSPPPRLKPPLTCDARRERPGRRPPVRTGRAEKDFARALRGVARHVGDLIKAFEEGTVEQLSSLDALLRSYAAALLPWARVTAGRMLQDVNKRDADAWRALGSSISVQLHRDLQSAQMGEHMSRLLGEQVELIQSIPVKAAERVNEITRKGLVEGTRAAEHVEEIMRSGHVAESHAMLIARTEVARTASVLTEARAQSAGSTHYIWRTAGDSAVRPGHKAMEGKVCAWADPPAVDENGRIMHHHPGRIWNCRCYAEPIVSDDYD